MNTVRSRACHTLSGPSACQIHKGAEVLKGNRNRRAAAWARISSTSLSLTAVALVQVEKDPCQTKGRVLWSVSNSLLCLVDLSCLNPPEKI